MATLQLMPMTTINGTTYATAQLILTPVSAQKKQSKTILPKQEPASPCQAPDDVTPTDFNRQISSVKPDCAKRRIHFSKKALTHPRPQAVTRRNTRERNRVKAVNQGERKQISVKSTLTNRLNLSFFKILIGRSRDLV